MIEEILTVQQIRIIDSEFALLLSKISSIVVDFTLQILSAGITNNYQ